MCYIVVTCLCVCFLVCFFFFVCGLFVHVAVFLSLFGCHFVIKLMLCALLFLRSFFAVFFLVPAETSNLRSTRRKATQGVKRDWLVLYSIVVTLFVCCCFFCVKSLFGLLLVLCFWGRGVIVILSSICFLCVLPFSVVVVCRVVVLLCFLFGCLLTLVFFVPAETSNIRNTHKQNNTKSKHQLVVSFMYMLLQCCACFALLCVGSLFVLLWSLCFVCVWLSFCYSCSLSCVCFSVVFL